MAKSKVVEDRQSLDDDSSQFSDADAPNVAEIDHSEPDTTNRPAKRRRVSVSSDDDSDGGIPVPAAPLPTISRIKKKSEVSSTDPKPQTEEPVTSQDARDIGLEVVDSTFATLNVAPWLVKSLSTMAIRRPTAIQKSCIPEILKGRDCIGGSRTGSGKTVAFAAPILQKWAEDPFGIFAVVLTPTR
jgi:ATP-dependent RNA helicase DDX49/DBP8